jgi:hypothetical protein
MKVKEQNKTHKYPHRKIQVFKAEEVTMKFYFGNQSYDITVEIIMYLIAESISKVPLQD